MKILATLLLFANLALGLWNYTHGPARPATPRPIHPERLQVVSAATLKAAPALPPVKPTPETPGADVNPGAANMKPKASGAPPVSKPRSAPAASAQSFKKTAFTAPVTARPHRHAQCWDLGPVGRHAAAAALLGRLHLPGRVVRHPGPPAYRLYLPAGTPWPATAALHKLGIKGAYVTHGPSGGAVLSLGVFLREAAARRELRALRAHHVAARIGPFGAPARYYAEVHLSSPSGAFWKRLGAVGHAPCRGGP